MKSGGKVTVIKAPEVKVNIRRRSTFFDLIHRRSTFFDLLHRRSTFFDLLQTVELAYELQSPTIILILGRL